MRVLSVALAVMLLSACGGGNEDRALAACEQSLKEKAQAKDYRIDKKQLLASAKSGAAGEVSIAGEVVFDPGLPREVTQRFECTTRVTEGKSEPDVISFSLVW
jgi:hypothetical protein